MSCENRGSAISIKGVGKCYHIYSKPYHRLLQGIFRNRKRFYKPFWAVKNVSFDVKKGETVGVVGSNGSGKTTLLQIICGTLTPSSGSVTIFGRVAALLALGAGFNPAYSGRENVYLYGVLLGLTRREVQDRYDEILAFADIGSFIEEPMNKYSSGMYVRLAFAVAVHVDPDVLIVDEALAVGDEAYKRKCYAKLKELTSKGMTLFFVSHSSGSVINLCDKAVLLNQGELLSVGEPKEIIASYQKLMHSSVAEKLAVIEEIKSGRRAGVDCATLPELPLKGVVEVRQGEGYLQSMKSKSAFDYPSVGAKISNVRVINTLDQQVNLLKQGATYFYLFDVVFTCPASSIRFGMAIKNQQGINVAGSMSSLRTDAIEQVFEGTAVSVKFAFDCHINPGCYFITCGVKADSDGDEVFLHRIVDAVMIKVGTAGEQIHTGLVNLGFECSFS